MKQTRIFRRDALSDADTVHLAQQLAQGAVGIFPTDTVYGLGTGARCEAAVAEIYRLKARPEQQPLQLLFASSARAREAAYFSPQALRLAQAYWPGALTLIVPPLPHATALARGFAGLGIRVPKDDFLSRLLAAMDGPLASTSANVHGQPVWTEEEPVLRAFAGSVDFIVLGGTLSPTASSVVDLMRRPRLLREGQLTRAQLEETLGEPFAV